MSAFTRAAQIIRTRNMHGGVVCKSAGTLPFLLAEGQTVHFVPPTLRGPRTTRVASVTPVGEDTWEVLFDSVTSLDDAEALVGSFCLVAKSELPEISPTNAPALLQGYAVCDDVFGELGYISGVSSSALQDVLEIEHGAQIVLVPLVDEFVYNIDDAAHIVYTRIPEGILNLNANPVQNCDSREGHTEC